MHETLVKHQKSSREKRETKTANSAKLTMVTLLSLTIGNVSPRMNARSRVTSGGSTDLTAEVLAAGQRALTDDSQSLPPVAARHPTPPAIPAHGKAPEPVRDRSHY